MLQSYNKTSKSWLFERKIQYTETYLEEGDELYVLGEVADFNGYYPIFKKHEKMMIVSDKGEGKLLKTTKQTYLISLLVFIALTTGVIFATIKLMS